MANEQNIIPHRFTSEQSRDEAARNGRKGGVASGKARRERKALSEALEALLSLPESKGAIVAIDDALSAAELDAANLTMQDRIALNVIRKAQGGDVRAVEIIRDTVGERPSDRLEVSVSANVERATKDIEALIAKHDEDKRRKAAALEEVAHTPGLPDNVKSALMELYRYELSGIEFD